MNLKTLDKKLRKAREEKRVIVFNFSTKELDYAHTSWEVVDDLA